LGLPRWSSWPFLQERFSCSGGKGKGDHPLSHLRIGLSFPYLKSRIWSILENLKCFKRNSNFFNAEEIP
jgi:hypothetical protein